MKNQFLALVLGLLTLSAVEAGASGSIKEVETPAAVADVPTGPALPYVMVTQLHDCIAIDIEAGTSPKAPESICMVLPGFTSELLKPPASNQLKPAYRSWYRR